MEKKWQLNKRHLMVFTSNKIADEIKVTEPKPHVINKQCVVYEYKWELKMWLIIAVMHTTSAVAKLKREKTDEICVMHNHVGYTFRYLFQCINEPEHSVISKHLRDVHNLRNKNLRD